MTLQRPGSALTGIAFVIAAVACFAVLDTSVKYLSASTSILLIVWVRYLFQAVVTTAVMLPLRGRRLVQTQNLRMQLLRGVLLLACSVIGFFGVKHMPLGEFTAMAMLTPLAVTVLAATVLKEKVSALRWLLVVGGFIGALVVIRPGTGMFGWAALFPLALVGTYASFQIVTARMARTEDTSTMHFYTGWTGFACACLALPAVWGTLPPSSLWPLLLLGSAAGTVGHLFLIQAFARAPAATLSPYLYVQIAFAMLSSWLVFDHLPDGMTVLGIVMIAIFGAAGAWLTAREGRLAIAAAEV